MKKLIDSLSNKPGEIAMAISLKLPESLLNSIDDIADSHAKSRNEVAVQLLASAVESYIASLDVDFENNAAIVFERSGKEKEPKHYIFNTNKGNEPLCDAWMIANKSVAAYYDKWSKHVDRLAVGDVVYLFRSGTGLVAYGYVADEESRSTDDPGSIAGNAKGKAKRLDPFIIFETPVSAAEVRKNMKRDVIFMRTCAEQPDGQKLFDALQEISPLISRTI